MIFSTHGSVRLIVLGMGIWLGALVGCGDDAHTEDISQAAVANLEVVDSVDDLPPCESEGELAWVKGETSARICADGKWFATASSDSVLSCEIVEFSDKNGVKVVCNGDSVGVVLNGATGKKGTDGKDGADGVNGTDCLLGETNRNSINVICGNDTTVLYMNGGAELDSEMVAVSLDTVSGVTQKGPFLSGSKVVVRELQDGRTLKQTGNTFNGKILNDLGEFRLNARTLMSQYVSLEATGYYRNEVTGENSSSELTLMAFSNVLKSKTVNINLLTHLEYERVNYLVTKKKYSVVKAKAQAQQEVFALFGIDATGFSSSEYLNIAGTSSEDGALLAFSILLQGDRSVSQLSELMTEIASDMETDGTWNDAKTRIKIADWAADADSSGRLNSIRKNVEDWKLSNMVPKFEPFVRNFWAKEYGLDTCRANRSGMVAAAKAGKRKDSKTRYICKEDSADVGEYRWVIANDFEKDIYNWKPGKDGAVKVGDVTGTKYYIYDGSIPQWRSATLVEQMLGGCVASVSSDPSKNRGFVNGFWYRCADREWQRTNAYIDSTEGWIENSDGDIKQGSVGTYLVYDESEGLWRDASENDVKLKLMGCTVNREGEYGRSRFDNRFYRCGESRDWIQVTDKAEYNTIGMVCDQDGKMVKGVFDSLSTFACDEGAWREMTADEENKGYICTISMEGMFNKDSTYICENKAARKTIIYDFEVGARNYFNPDVEYGTLKDDRDGRVYKTVKLGDQVWMAENLKFFDERTNHYLVGQTGCYKDDSTNCLKTGRLYSWYAAMDIDSKWWGCHLPEGMIESPHRGICPKGWHIPTREELTLANATANYLDFLAKNADVWPDATNKTGFSALPTGDKWGYSNMVRFWSATEKMDAYGYYAYVWMFWTDKATIYDEGGKEQYYSVRCIQDSL